MSNDDKYNEYINNKDKYLQTSYLFLKKSFTDLTLVVTIFYCSLSFLTLVVVIFSYLNSRGISMSEDIRKEIF